ncbi:MAG TPA: PqqD family protein [Candidatus Acidoferrum sp.]|nr:PqqD family protein [Candidatus Acidoferrum sp.]
MTVSQVNSSSIFRRNPKLAWREIDGEVVIISPDDSILHELNETASAVWHRIDGESGLGDIAKSLAEDYGAPIETVRADVEELAADLSAKNLLLAREGEA